MIRFAGNREVNERSMIVLNLTNKPVVAYSDEGELIRLLPIKEDDIPALPNEGKVAFLINDDRWEKLDYCEKMSNEYVHVGITSTGRNNLKVSSLESYREKIGCAPVRIFPSNVSSYRKIDKNKKLYTVVVEPLQPQVKVNTRA